jgi:hypothetical protein
VLGRNSPSKMVILGSLGNKIWRTILVQQSELPKIFPDRLNKTECESASIEP